MSKVNLHLYQSPFTHETRILRITKSLASARVFDRVCIIASLRQENTTEHERLDEARDVWRIPSRFKRRGLVSKILITLEWSLRAFFYAVKKDVACVNAHALSVLPLSALIKVRKGCKLVYDAHEIETETGEVKGIRRVFSKFIEKVLIRYVDIVSLTSEGHAWWYRKEYNLDNVRVIRNCPYARNASKPGTGASRNALRAKFKIPEDALLFLYQGDISKPRGVELLMRAFSRLPQNKHIVFLGFGSELNLLLDYQNRCPNIHYHPAVPPGELVHYTACADAGIHMMDDSCINHMYALPNKPMEYMNAGIPAIVSDLPVMGKLIRDSGAGWAVPVNDEAALESLIVRLSKEEIAERAARARAWASANTWEKEEQILFAVYREIGFN